MTSNFRCHVTIAASLTGHFVSGFVDELAKTKIRKHGFEIIIKENISGLDVSMNDMIRVKIFEAFGKAENNLKTEWITFATDDAGVV